MISSSTIISSGNLPTKAPLPTRDPAGDKLGAKALEVGPVKVALAHPISPIQSQSFPVGIPVSFFENGANKAIQKVLLQPDGAVLIKVKNLDTKNVESKIVDRVHIQASSDILKLLQDPLKNQTILKALTFRFQPTNDGDYTLHILQPLKAGGKKLNTIKGDPQPSNERAHRILSRLYAGIQTQPAERNAASLGLNLIENKEWHMTVSQNLCGVYLLNSPTNEYAKKMGLSLPKLGKGVAEASNRSEIVSKFTKGKYTAEMQTQMLAQKFPLLNTPGASDLPLFLHILILDHSPKLINTAGPFGGLYRAFLPGNLKSALHVAKKVQPAISVDPVCDALYAQGARQNLHEILDSAEEKPVELNRIFELTHSDERVVFFGPTGPETVSVSIPDLPQYLLNTLGFVPKEMINERNSAGKTPLYRALSEAALGTNRTKLVDHLLNLGASATDVPEGEESYLSLSKRHVLSPPVLAKLVRAGMPEKEGAIHHLLAHQDQLAPGELVSLIQTTKPSVDTVIDGETIMMKAIRLKMPTEIIAALAQQVKQPSSGLEDGKNLVDFAREKEASAPVIEILERQGLGKSVFQELDKKGWASVAAQEWSPSALQQTNREGHSIRYVARQAGEDQEKKIVEKGAALTAEEWVAEKEWEKVPKYDAFFVGSQAEKKTVLAKALKAGAPYEALQAMAENGCVVQAEEAAPLLVLALQNLLDAAADKKTEASQKVLLLARLGCNINADHEGKPLLFKLLTKENQAKVSPEILTFLKGCGADFNRIEPESKETVLTHSLKQGASAAFIQALIMNGANPFLFLDDKYTTPFLNFIPTADTHPEGGAILALLSPSPEVFKVKENVLSVIEGCKDAKVVTDYITMARPPLDTIMKHALVSPKVSDQMFYQLMQLGAPFTRDHIVTNPQLSRILQMQAEGGTQNRKAIAATAMMVVPEYGKIDPLHQFFMNGAFTPYKWNAILKTMGDLNIREYRTLASGRLDSQFSKRCKTVPYIMPLNAMIAHGPQDLAMQMMTPAAVSQLSDHFPPILDACRSCRPAIVQQLLLMGHDVNGGYVPASKGMFSKEAPDIHVSEEHGRALSTEVSPNVLDFMRTESYGPPLFVTLIRGVMYEHGIRNPGAISGFSYANHTPLDANNKSQLQFLTEYGNMVRYTAEFVNPSDQKIMESLPKVDENFFKTMELLLMNGARADDIYKKTFATYRCTRDSQTKATQTTKVNLNNILLFAFQNGFGKKWVETMESMTGASACPRFLTLMKSTQAYWDSVKLSLGPINEDVPPVIKDVKSYFNPEKPTEKPVEKPVEKPTVVVEAASTTAGDGPGAGAAAGSGGVYQGPPSAGAGRAL